MLLCNQIITHNRSLLLLLPPVQDCDMPSDLNVPETRPEAGVDHVDVMGMLGLKRAKSLKKDDGSNVKP
jgi:hypothetical protein